MDIRKTGLFICELRKEKGYTQKELAGKLIVSDKAVSRWETGKGLPDTAVLVDLSKVLGVSVGEILAGERLTSESREAETDKVIIDMMDYAQRTLAKICNGILIAVGSILLISPVFTAGRAYYILGLVPIALAVLRMTMRKNQADRIKTQYLAYISALVCMVTALILETLPYGVVLNFASGPGVTITQTYSYFSMTPFGYADFFPLPTGILTVLIVFLSAVSLLKRLGSARLQNAAFICTIIAFVLSFLPGLMFGAKYMSFISLMVTSLLFLSLLLQAFANRDNYL